MKEAVFKTLSHFRADERFDFAAIELAKHANGNAAGRTHAR